MFEILKKDKNSLARVGSLKTSHGVIETPAYAIAATDGWVRTLEPEDLASTRSQIFIVNTFHIWKRFGFDQKLTNFSGIHQEMSWQGPLMSDSGGFQVFSYGFGREHQVGKIASFFPRDNQPIFQPELNLVKVTHQGVLFKDGESEIFLGPRESIKIQEKIGADIILSFDECTSPFNDYFYTRDALRRTHRWAKICLETKSRRDQLLFGIVQGGAWKDLRTASASYLSQLPFDGFAIGGSLGKSKEEMFRILKWVIPLLPEDKPRHLLGIGRPEDIFEAVKLGIDLFDCVVPTREARHGSLWTKKGRIDILKTKYLKDFSLLDGGCQCPVCQKGVSRSELHQMFKQKDPLAGRLSTLHNVFFFNDFMEKMRQAIKEDEFEAFSHHFSFLLSPSK